MNNITVERVMNAYEAGDIIPSFEGWGNREKNCGCAITAAIIHEKPNDFPDINKVLENHDDFGTNDICEAANITWPYMLGFTDAFDGAAFGTSDQTGNADVWDEIDQAEYHMGFDHGKKAREAVFDKYFPSGYQITEGSV